LPALSAVAQTTVEITNGFGATKQFEVPPGASVKIDNYVENSACDGILPLRLSATTFVCVMSADLSTAEKGSGAALKVTLKNGVMLEGAPFGTLAGNGLAGATGMKVLAIKASAANGGTPKAPEDWVLTLSGPSDTSFDIQDAGFSAGYIMGGRSSTRFSRSLFLNRGGEELTAPLSDFTQVVITKATGGASISVTVPNGTVTEGKFLLKETDSAGVHEASDWRLVGRLHGTVGTNIVTSAPAITLRRK
jgi:hypothetical protein